MISRFWRWSGTPRLTRADIWFVVTLATIVGYLGWLVGLWR